MQRAYILALHDLMETDSRIVSLLSDSGTDYDAMLARDYPSRCFNFGIAEQNKVAAASGMAALGKIPFVYTTGTFIAYRAYEFLRNNLCFQNRHVIMVGMGMGMGHWSTLGATHHSTEDIAALRVLPNLTLLCASTPLQLQWCIRTAYEIPGPVYLRMGMSGEKELYKPDSHFEISKPCKLHDGEDFTVFTTGTIAAEALEAVRQHAAHGRSIALFDVHSLKPIGREYILDAVHKAKKVFTVEEHALSGGLGGAVAEILSHVGTNTPLIRIGLDNRFAKGYGTTADVRRENGLDAAGIYERLADEIDISCKVL